MLALGVINAVVLVELGAVPKVTATPPALYPAPETSFVTEYAVVAALTVALVKYNAALNVSAVASVCAGTPVLLNA
jgi:hypothetical protein